VLSHINYYEPGGRRDLVTIVFRFAENRRYGEPEGNVQDAQMPNRATLTEANSPRV